MSQSQLGIYLGSAEREDTAYHIAYAFRFPADTDTARLKAAVVEVLSCHPALNAAVTTDDSGEARMEWDGMTAGDIPVISASDAEFDELKAGLIEHIDMPGDRLCRFRIVHTPRAVWLTMLVHHIIFDGTSLRIFLHDLDTALKGGHPEAETFTCFDVAEKEVTARSGSEFEAQRRYYADTFGDFDADGSVLYSDAKGERQFSHKVFRLNTSRGELKGGAALANAAMGIALGAFTGSDDVLFSTIYHGRNTPDTDNTVGMLVRTLPVRCRLGNDVTASALVTAMKEQTAATRAADLFSFVDFAAMTGYEQNVLFAYQGTLLDFDPLCEGMVSERIDAGETGVPMSIQMFLTAEGIDVDVLWRSDMYSENTVDRLVATLDLALGQLCDPANVSLPVSALRLINDVAEDELKNIESTPALDFDHTVPIEGVIAAVAREIPDKPAVVTPAGSFTYAEIDRISTVMAQNLVKRGVGPGMAVGVMIPRSEWMVLIPLAVMKAGAAYMPLDPTFPEERLMFMTDDAGVGLILTVDGLADKVLPSFPGEIADAALLTAGKAVPAGEWAANPGSPFVILYTSGSTGKPKGVTLTRGNLLNFVHDYKELVSLG